MRKGKFVSEDTKKKISKSKKGSIPWNQGLIKDTILQIDFDNNIINEWNNLIELEKSGFQKSNVINVCNGKRKSHKGYKWIYKSKFE
jgi:NUMOD3 motif